MRRKLVRVLRAGLRCLYCYFFSFGLNILEWRSGITLGKYYTRVFGLLTVYCHFNVYILEYLFVMIHTHSTMVFSFLFREVGTRYWMYLI